MSELRNIPENKLIPFRVDCDEENLVRVKYQHIPQSVSGDKTVARSLFHSEEEPQVGYMYHTIENGEEVKFSGTWIKNSESTQQLQDCVLIFRDDEVICVPVEYSLIHLRMCQDE